MSEFLHMGGYGAYIWPCFLLTAVVLGWNVAAARRLHWAARQHAVRRSAATRDAQ
jgi:heme exporter protein CcmD